MSDYNINPLALDVTYGDDYYVLAKYCDILIPPLEEGGISYNIPKVEIRTWSQKVEYLRTSAEAGVYTVPDGDSLAFNFVETPYTSPNGDDVDFSFTTGTSSMAINVPLAETETISYEVSGADAVEVFIPTKETQVVSYPPQFYFFILPKREIETDSQTVEYLTYVSPDVIPTIDESKIPELRMTVQLEKVDTVDIAKNIELIVYFGQILNGIHWMEIDNVMGIPITSTKKVMERL